MSDPNSNPLDPSRLPAGARVRAVADGELGPEALAGIDGAEASVGFERALREFVATSMTGAGAPADLRDRIRTMLESGADAEAPGVVRTPRGDTRRQSFWSHAGRYVAAAAAVALVALVGIVASQQSSNVAQASLTPGILANFVESEHLHCENDKGYTQKLIERASTREDAEKLARAWLGAVPKIISQGFKEIEDAGFTFAGMGQCHVPGEGHSVHLLFRDAHDQAHMVSLYIQVDRNQWDLDSGRCARLDDSLKDDESALVWLDDGFLEVLFVDAPDDAEPFRTALHTPTHECALRAR